MTPEDFPRAFAAAFSARDAAALVALLAEDADLATVTGQWAEGRVAAEGALAGEFAGLFAAARLVTGRSRLSRPAPGVAVLAQRYVLSGVQDAAGAAMPRMPLLLLATLVERPDGWQAVSVALSTLSG